MGKTHVLCGLFHFEQLLYSICIWISQILKQSSGKTVPHYVAQSLNVDVSSFGESKQEALTNLREALELYFEGSKTMKLPKVERPEIFSSKVKYA